LINVIKKYNCFYTAKRLTPRYQLSIKTILINLLYKNEKEMVNMLQAILEQPGKVLFREVEKPRPGKNEVLVKIKKVGVCGSDVHAYYGKHPYISCPIVQGHEFAGQITEVGENAGRFKPGDNVTVMPQLICGKCYNCTHGRYNICSELKVIGCQAEGAAQEFFAVDEKLVLKLPDGMSYDHGAMIEPLAVGIHALDRMGGVKGLNLVIFGAGPIGNLTAQAAKGLGAKSVMIVDLSDYRLGIAKKCGIDITVNTSKENLDAAITQNFGKDRADAMIECVGVQPTIDQAVKLSRKGTDIVVVGVFGQKPQVDMGLVQDKELRLIGTLMYMENDYHKAIELINSGMVDLNPLISKYFSFKEYGEAYLFIEKNSEKTMKVLIDMEK
jgi:L-iditol 2-dehydrogenase